MNVTELIDRLEDLDPQAEVRFVYQASYPLQDKVQGVWHAEDNEKVVYIVSGGQNYDEPYGPRAAFQEAW